MPIVAVSQTTAPLPALSHLETLHHEIDELRRTNETLRTSLASVREELAAEQKNNDALQKRMKKLQASQGSSCCGCGFWFVATAITIVAVAAFAPSIPKFPVEQLKKDVLEFVKKIPTSVDLTPLKKAIQSAVDKIFAR